MSICDPESTAGKTGLCAEAHDLAASWGAAKHLVIPEVTSWAYRPSVGVGSSGNTMVVWWQNDDDWDINNIWANRYEHE